VGRGEERLGHGESQKGRKPASRLRSTEEIRKRVSEEDKGSQRT
jgi:hypothetical protein